MSVSHEGVGKEPYSMIKIKVLMRNLASRSLRIAVSATTTVGTLPRCTVNT